MSALLSTSTEAPVLSVLGRRIWSLPPVGGHRNELDATDRTIRIIQVAATGFGTVISLALLIAGAFTLFG
jgi:hypothetical protein